MKTNTQSTHESDAITACLNGIVNPQCHYYGSFISRSLHVPTKRSANHFKAGTCKDLGYTMLSLERFVVVLSPYVQLKDVLAPFVSYFFVLLCGLYVAVSQLTLQMLP